MARSALLLALALTAVLCASAAHAGGPARGPVPPHPAKAAAPQGKPAPAAAPQGKPAVPQGKPAAPQGKPAPTAAPAAKPTAPEVKPAPAAVPAAKPAAPEVKPAPAAVPAAKPAAPEAKPAPAAAPAKPAAPEVKPAAPVAAPAAPVAAAPVNATPAAPANATAAPAAVPPKTGEPAKAPVAQAAAPNATAAKPNATAQAPAPKAPTTPAAPPSCATIKGCKSCLMVPVRRRPPQLSCTACEGPSYVLAGRGVNFCQCAAGYSTHTINGTLTANCTAVPKGWVAAPAPLNHPAGIPKLCGPGSVPDQSNSRCLCAPGYYQLLQGGQTPRCVACPPTLYNDAPNTRLTCKICPLGKVANAAGTGCVPLTAALTETNQIISENLAAVKSAVNPTIAKINSTITETLQELAGKMRKPTAEDQAAFEAPPPKPVKAGLKLGSGATEGFAMVPAAGQVVANTAAGPAGAGAANGTLKLESAALPAALLNAAAAAQAVALNSTVAALNATAAKAGVALPSLPVPSAVLAAQKAAADKLTTGAANGTTPVLGGRKIAPPAPGKRARKGFDLSSLFGSRLAGLKDITAPAPVHAAGVPAAGPAATGGAAIRRSAWADWLAARSKKAKAKPAAAEGEEAEEEAEEEEQEDEAPDDSDMLGKWVSPDGTNPPANQTNKAAPPPKKKGKKSGKLTKWQQVQMDLSEKGISLPTWQSLTGVVPAMEVPGLEKGAATPALAVGKMLWALAKDPDFMDAITDIGRGAANAVNSGDEARH